MLWKVNLRACDWIAAGGHSLAGPFASLLPHQGHPGIQLGLVESFRANATLVQVVLPPRRPGIQFRFQKMQSS